MAQPAADHREAEETMGKGTPAHIQQSIAGVEKETGTMGATHPQKVTRLIYTTGKGFHVS